MTHLDIFKKLITKPNGDKQTIDVYMLNNPTRQDIRVAYKQLGCTRKQFKKRIKKARRHLVSLQTTMQEQPRLEGL